MLYISDIAISFWRTMHLPACDVILTEISTDHYYTPRKTVRIFNTIQIQIECCANVVMKHVKNVCHKSMGIYVYQCSMYIRVSMSIKLNAHFISLHFQWIYFHISRNCVRICTCECLGVLVCVCSILYTLPDFKIDSTMIRCKHFTVIKLTMPIFTGKHPTNGRK